MKQSDGFTIIETLVTIVVGGMFVAVFSSLYIVVSTQSTATNQKALASAIAYSNMRKFNTTIDPVWFNCNSSTDLVSNPHAPGQVLLAGHPTNTDGLAEPVSQFVRAFAPQGCGAEMPVMIVSSIRYGTPSKSIRHVSYVGQ
jgi:prepilin-type N-terminal cleavage/methylation domain-containing protein